MCIGVHAYFSQMHHSEMEVCEVEQCFYMKVAVLQMKIYGNDMLSYIEH